MSLGTVTDDSRHDLLTRRFALDAPIALPKDTIIIIPRDGAHTSQGRQEHGGDTERIRRVVANKFLAVSSEVATYVSLDRRFLPTLKALLDGKTLRNVLPLLDAEFGQGNGRPRLSEMLTHFSIRNFFADAERRELADDWQLQIYVTNRCNLRCVHCYMSSGDPLPQGEVGTEERRKAIEQFAKLAPGGMVTFTGGEALLNRDIFDLIALAKERGLRVTLFSNGVTIRTPLHARRVVDQVDVLQISLDGATADANDWVRGTGSFERIVKALKLVDDAIDQTDNHAFRYRVAITLLPQTIADVREHLPSLIDRLDLRHKPEIRIAIVGKQGRAAENPEFGSATEDVRRAQNALMHELAERGLYRFPPIRQNVYSRSCGMGSTITVGADGAIYPCTITSQPSVGKMTDGAADDTLKSVLDYSQATNVDNVEGCRSCAVRYFCGGMCRITNLHRMGSMTVSACTPDHKQSVLRDLTMKYETFSITHGLMKSEPTET